MPKTKQKLESFLKPASSVKPSLSKVNGILASVFYSLWILIGAFFLLVIAGQIRQGVLRSIVGGPNPNQVPQVEAPAETNLPGVGKVNIACVQKNLDQVAIQKLVQEGNASTLTDEEKTKLAPCIVEAENPNPSPSPTP